MTTQSMALKPAAVRASSFVRTKVLICERVEDVKAFWVGRVMGGMAGLWGVLGNVDVKRFSLRGCEIGWDAIRRELVPSGNGEGS